MTLLSDTLARTTTRTHAHSAILTRPARHTRAAIGARVTLHTRERHTQTSSIDKRPHFSSHGKREGESERKMEVRRERRERRDRERKRKMEGVGGKKGPALSLFEKVVVS